MGHFFVVVADIWDTHDLKKEECIRLTVSGFKSMAS